MKGNRILFLDNLRGFSILILVIFFHPAAIYSKILGPTLQFYLTSPTSFLYDSIALICDSFLMSLLFFIAGYFAIPSAKKRSNLAFIRDKFLHILLPFLLGMILLNAYPNYVKSVVMDNYPYSYGHYWLNYLKNFTFFLKHNKASVHLWFLSLLFLFYLLFLPFYRLFIQNRRPSKRNLSFIYLTLFGAIGAIAFFIIDQWLPDFGGWRNFEYLWTFQSTRLPLYILYFGLGIFAYHYQAMNTPLSKSWLYLAIGLSGLHLYFFYIYFPDIFYRWGLGLVYSFLFSFNCLSLCLSSIDLFRKGLNRTNSFLQCLSRNSYAIYIIHFSIFIWVEKRVLDMSLPPFIKYLGGGIVIYLLCLLFSEVILRRVPFLNQLLFGKVK